MAKFSTFISETATGKKSSGPRCKLTMDFIIQDHTQVNFVGQG